MTDSRRRWTGILCLALAVLAGCGRPSAPPSITSAKQTNPADELAETVADTFRKSGDLATYRRLVDQLNVYLGRAPANRPAALSAEQRRLLTEEFRLHEVELAEVAREEYTPLDAYYLDETVLARDIASALDVGGLPPVERAAAALAWVGVNLTPAPAGGLAAPPGFVALRGSANIVERTYVLLRLLGQLDLDACLIGDEAAGQSTDGIWAVGVLADKEIYLFDVRLGVPLPGPDGKGVATLAQAQADGKALPLLAVDPKLPYDVTPERARKARVFVTAPLSALAPRLTFLQKLIPPNAARLDVDLAAQRDRFRAAIRRPADDAGVHLWNPPVPDSLPRVLMSFLPAAEGGTDRAEKRRLDLFRLQGIPWGMLPPFLGELQGEAGARVKSMFFDRYTMLSQPGKARELILRGLFDEAAKQLVEVQAEAVKRPIAASAVEENVREWSEQARRVYADLARAERAGDVAELEKQKELVDILWRKSQGLNYFLAYLVSDPLLAESTFLLAVCKHEEAERRAYRKEPAGEAWQTAQMWWTKYINTYGASSAAPTARRHLARALAGAGRTAEARSVYQSLAESNLPPLERLACAYLASQLK